jgi:hypothetical protein
VIVRLLLIGCGMLTRELSDAIVHSPHSVAARFCSAGLHDRGAGIMRATLQQMIDETAAGSCDYIVLGYGLCGNGIAGLEARSIPLVAPRAHDCITLLWGSRQAYREHMERNPGTYFRSAGWVEHGEQLSEPAGRSTVNTPLRVLVERYGEENGTYLYQELHRYEDTYTQLAFIKTGLEPDASFEQRAQAEAGRKGWSYLAIQGSTGLFRRLLAGEWDQDFLVVPPGHRIVPAYDDNIVQAVRCDEAIPNK